MATKKNYVISVDLGTSSVRACLVNSNLSILFQAQEFLDFITDIQGKAEQVPDQVLDVSMRTISQAADYAREHDCAIQAICFSNAVSSLVQLNADFIPLGDFLTYADLRSYKEVENLRDRYQPDFFKKSAVPLHASYWLPKILWLKNNGLRDNSTQYFCTIKDLLVHRLTGRFVTDQSNAVATGICDAKTIEWYPAFLEILGLNSVNFPKIYPTTEKFEILSEIKATLGLPEGTELILGATDGVLSSLGAGAVNPGQVTTMIGSSGACRIASDSPLMKEDNLTWSYPLADGIWIRGGAMNSGGLVSNWFLENFYKELDADLPAKIQKGLEEIQSIPAGSDGLIFLPYIFGERAPIWDEKARGVFFGIHAKHGRSHFARAVFEGIIFSLFSIFEIIQTGNSNDVEIRATGGYTRSEEFLQIQADVFGKQICVPEDHEGSAIGVAVLAFFALGTFDSLQTAAELIGIKKIIEPNQGNRTPYQNAYQRFKGLYTALKPEFRNGQ